MALENKGAAPANNDATDQSAAEPSDAELSAILFPSAKSPAAKAASGNDSQDETADIEGDTDEDLADDNDEEAEAGDSSADGDQDEGDDESAPSGEADDQPADDTDNQDETEGEADAGEETDDAPAELDEEDRKTRAKFTPEQQKLFDKAIQKKARKAAELREQLTAHEQNVAQLQADLEAARQAPPAPVAPTPDNPLADVADEAALDQRIAQNRAARRWALAHPQGGLAKDAEGNEVEITPERVGEILAETEELIQEHAPARRAFIQQSRQAEQEALTSYPWLKNKGTAGYQEIETALRRYPQLRGQIPDIKLAMADMLIGRNMRLLQKQQQKNQGAKTQDSPGLGTRRGGKKPAKAPATPAGGARPPRVQAGAQQRVGASKRLEATGEDPGNEALSSILTQG